MVNIEGSYINIMESDAPGNFNLAFGIVNNENGAINMANTDITVTSFNAGLTAGILNNSTVGAGNVNVIGSNITILADNSSLAAAIFNQANNIAGIGGTVNVDQSILSVLSNNNGGGIGAGVFNSAQSTANITNTTINSSGNDGIITGIFNTDPLGTVNIQNDTISINLSGTAFGFPIINVGTLNDNGGNQCFQDGMSVPC